MILTPRICTTLPEGHPDVGRRRHFPDVDPHQVRDLRAVAGAVDGHDAVKVVLVGRGKRDCRPLSSPVGGGLRYLLMQFSDKTFNGQESKRFVVIFNRCVVRDHP